MNQKSLNIKAEMKASEEFTTALRFKLQMDFYLIGTDERANKLCCNVDHQNQNITEMKLFISKNHHLMHRAL